MAKKLCITIFFVFLTHIKALPNDLKQNLFQKHCNLIGDNFRNCSLIGINIYPFSNIYNEEMSFDIDYEFKNCNFDYLNIELYTTRNYFRINTGNKSIQLDGYTLNIRDTYEWFTNGSRYDGTCSFIIKKINTSFSIVTKVKINRYFSISNELKQSLIKFNELKNYFNDIKTDVLNIKFNPNSEYFYELKNSVAKIKEENKDSDFFNLICTLIQQEIDIANSSTPGISSEKIQEWKRNILDNINQINQTIDIQKLTFNLNNYKSEINKILTEGKKIPNFNMQEIEYYENELKKI